MSNLLSHSLNPLAVKDGRITDDMTKQPVLLRGVNRSGLEYSGSAGNAGITAKEIDFIVTEWGANVIRLPFNQEWVLARDSDLYLNALDFVIERAARNGAYTLLDLQWLDSTTPRGVNNKGEVNRVPALPNVESIELWRRIAGRYKEEPAVLYDIFNEPHSALDNDETPLFGIRPDGTTFALHSKQIGMREWQPWAGQLIGAIRGVNPAALIFVSGVDWAFDLEGFPLPGDPPVVYSTHVYRDKGDFREAAFGRLAEEGVAVFAGEWGGEDTAWGADAADYFDELGIGWAAWSWANRPFLVTPPPTPPYTPTAFGRLVRERLRDGQPPV